ncbi:MAG: hypothetical protein ACXW18_08755 [Pyrinomonadaceae bacterium]
MSRHSIPPRCQLQPGKPDILLVRKQEVIDEHHGVKVHFGLNPKQRLDVQSISNMETK